MSTNTYKGHTKLYIIIFIILAVLTVLELAIPGLKNVSYAIKATSLTLLAVAKAFCVAYFYMHLNEESRWLKFIAAIPITAAIFAVMVILDSVYR